MILSQLFNDDFLHKNQVTNPDLLAAIQKTNKAKEEERQTFIYDLYTNLQIRDKLSEKKVKEAKKTVATWKKTLQHHAWMRDTARMCALLIQAPNDKLPLKVLIILSTIRHKLGENHGYVSDSIGNIELSELENYFHKPLTKEQRQKFVGFRWMEARANKEFMGWLKEIFRLTKAYVSSEHVSQITTSTELTEEDEQDDNEPGQDFF